VTRILEGFDARLNGRFIHAHRSVADTRLLREMADWRPDGKGPDDGLDAVAGCLNASRTRPDDGPASPARGIRRIAHGSVHRADTDFAP